IDLRERCGRPRRLAEGPCVRVGQDAREVATLAEDRRKRRPDDDLVDLVHDRDQPLPEHVERYRIEGRRHVSSLVLPRRLLPPGNEPSRRYQLSEFSSTVDSLLDGEVKDRQCGQPPTPNAAAHWTESRWRSCGTV